MINGLKLEIGLKTLAYEGEDPYYFHSYTEDDKCRGVDETIGDFTQEKIDKLLLFIEELGRE